MTKRDVEDYLSIRSNSMEEANRNTPFPFYDTGYIAYTKEKLKEFKDMAKEEYDKLPVTACKYCKSLFIINDDIENEHCGKCGSVNSTTIYKSISDYLEEGN